MFAISKPPECDAPGGGAAPLRLARDRMHARVARAAAFIWSSTAVLIVVVAGLIKLEVPLYGDQALFLSYAQDIIRGQLLYVDLWDVKPPAIFAFYEIGGRLFGLSDLGIHAFELLWMTALAILLLAALKPHMRQRWVAAVAPIASVGVYYANCTPHEQTQVEALVNLPLLAAAVALSAAVADSRRRSLLALIAGVAAAVATLFKVVFAPILILFVVVASVRLLRESGGTQVREVLVRLWLPFAAAVIGIWLLVLLTFVLLGTAQAMLWTVFVYPFAALSDVQLAPLKRLVVNVRLLLGDFGPWLVFLPLAMWPRGKRRMPLLVQLAWTWLFAGLVVILLQRTSWWYYHFMLLMVPIGILAAYGIDRAVAWLRVRARLSHRLAMGLSCLLVLPASASLLDPLGTTANLLFPPLFMGSKTMEDFKETYPHYANAADAAAFVRGRDRPGPAMVFETPLINLLAGRAQPAPVAGLLWGWVLPKHYRSTAEILRADPPPFIFVGTDFAERVQTWTPEIVELLAERYALVWESAYGRWYELRSAPDASQRDESGRPTPPAY